MERFGMGSAGKERDSWREETPSADTPQSAHSGRGLHSSLDRAVSRTVEGPEQASFCIFQCFRPAGEETDSGKKTLTSLCPRVTLPVWHAFLAIDGKRRPV